MEDLWGDLRKIVGGCLEHFYRDLFRYVFFVDRICIGRIFSIQYSQFLIRSYGYMNLIKFLHSL